MIDYNRWHNDIFYAKKNPSLSIVYNVNVGHATPRCIIPFGVDAEVNVDEQVVYFRDELS